MLAKCFTRKKILSKINGEMQKISYLELRNVTFRPSLRGGAKRRRGNLRKDGIASLHFVPLSMTERVGFVIQGM